ncbi:MAG: hypothetical protein H6721_18095 [Sandaracinus sp.]|nr:hypothetical protein [Sandaracinus sp.]MCB9634035.1 hypothetical protein [Sandaracinus sp.]
MLQRTSDAVREARDDSGVTAEAAEHAAERASLAAEDARRGEAEAEQLSALLLHLHSVQERLVQLSELVGTIRRKASVIDEIAAQSNMLAINARIEAARAGRMGQGFAVVATSVRDLAQQSRAAANEIDEALERGVREVGDVNTMVQRLSAESAPVVARFRDGFHSLSDAILGVADDAVVISRTLRSQHENLSTLNECVLRAAEDQASTASDVVELVTGVSITELDPRDAHARLAGLRVLDVRSLDEFHGDLGHIGGALLRTLGPELEHELGQMPRDQPCLFVCRRGGRSIRAARIAQRLGFTQLFNLRGGMEAWRDARLPRAA